MMTQHFQCLWEDPFGKIVESDFSKVQQYKEVNAYEVCLLKYDGNAFGSVSPDL